MGGDVRAAPGAGVARDEAEAPAAAGRAAGGRAARQRSRAREVAAGDPDHRDQVVGGPEPVDVALAEPGAAAQRPRVGARVADLDPRPQLGVGGPEAEPAAALVDLEPAAADPRAARGRAAGARARRGSPRALRVRVPGGALEPQAQRLPVDPRRRPARSSPGSESAFAAPCRARARAGPATASRRRRAAPRGGSRCGPGGRRRGRSCATRRRGPCPSAARRESASRSGR